MTALLGGKVALVTGAASGIGRATALLMADEGARVLVSDLPGEALADTARMIAARGGTALAAAADVTVAGEVEAMVGAALSAWGRLDCAFNNAGIGAAALQSGGQRVGDLSAHAWERMIAVNLTSVWSCMAVELAAMERGGGGAIVNTASVAGLVGLPGSGAYVAAKHGVVGLTKAAAIDHAAAGIRVNAVCPGYIETPMIGEAMARRGEQIIANLPLKRLGQPGEVAELVVWLCSDRSSFVTGAAYAVDGGYTAV